jgi:RecB family exonuclease
MRLVTPSQMALAFKCAGPFLLPRVERLTGAADRGTVIHKYLELRALVDPHALELVPEEYRDECARVDCSGVAGLPEIAIAWHPVSDTARVLTSEGRDYDVRDGEIAGRADLIQIAGDHARVVDYKTGHADIEPVTANWQLRTLAVMVSRAYGCTTVDAEVWKLREDGGWFRDSARWDAFDLDGFADEIRRRLSRLRVVSELGGTPDLVTGDHCRWCPSLTYCPAQTALVSQLAGGDLATLDREVAALAPEAAGVAYSRLVQYEALLDRVRSAIELRASMEPLPLPDGKMLQAVDEKRDFVNGSVAIKVLSEKYGEKVAAAACETKVVATKKSIQQACGKDAREALAAIAERDGIVTKRYQKVRVK